MQQNKIRSNGDSGEKKDSSFGDENLGKKRQLNRVKRRCGPVNGAGRRGCNPEGRSSPERAGPAECVDIRRNND